ncbi:uncharacterized protein RAG0_10971 [Rhynchosporium agropyri]|uniref:Uncharacterized protein n=1 Tax=Rhynchosporium agropyri TaxID=914238 RepID=A0A1E1L232_9HELO|nr:uncharacterized protein RAG0_10971 [Rhynchosporium agropyri]
MGDDSKTPRSPVVWSPLGLTGNWPRKDRDNCRRERRLPWRVFGIAVCWIPMMTEVCHDPKDRIYALLSHLRENDPIKEAIEPDFSKSVEQVYRGVTLRQMQLSGQLRPHASGLSRYEASLTIDLGILNIKGCIADLNDFKRPSEYVVLGEIDDNIEDWYSTRHLKSHLTGRALFRTKEGHIGLCAAAAEVGNSIVIAHGCPTPLLLRSKYDGYLRRADFYVAGLMKGEALYGPLPPGWTVESCRIFDHERVPLFKDPNGQTTPKDHRLNEFGTSHEASQASSLFHSHKRRFSQVKQRRPDSDNMVTRLGEGICLEKRPSNFVAPIKTLRGLKLQDFTLI